MNRRNFLEKTSKLSLAAGSWAIAPQTLGKNYVRKSANEKIVIGAIGVNGMGNAIMNLAINQPNVEYAAICDVDENVANKRADEVFNAGNEGFGCCEYWYP
jgi:hypothetical protein